MNLGAYYVWVKAVHAAAALLFTGGVMSVALFLRTPWSDGADAARLAVALRQWDRAVTVPAMLLVWALGMTLVSSGRWSGSAWLIVKVALVVLLSAMHGIQSGRLRRISVGHRVAPVRALPLVALAVVAIVVLAVAKPF